MTSFSKAHTPRPRARLGALLALLPLLALSAPRALAQDADGAPDAQGETLPQSEDQTPEQLSEQAQPAPVAELVAPKYQPRTLPEPETGWLPLGDLNDESGKTALSFSNLGAGVATVRLPNDYETIEKQEHVTLQQIHTIGEYNAVPFAALGVEVNGVMVPLAGADVWSQVGAGVFEAFVDDDEGNPVLRVERRFELSDASHYGFTITQTIENLTSVPVNARLVSTGAVDMPRAKSTYAGDRRRVRYGYLQSPEMQKGDMTVVVDRDLNSRATLLGKRISSGSAKFYPSSEPVWPTEKTSERGRRLSWIAFSDRYFTVLMHPQFDPGVVSSPEEKLMGGIDSIDRLILNPGANSLESVMILRLTGEDVTVEPGSSYAHTLGVYAGPRTKPIFNDDPLLVSLNVPSMVVYNLGGFCAPCTFPWLTDILISVLRLFHSISGDWAVAILMLVLLVRGCLHPVTRWSQIRMQRFGVQMQSMGPKQKAIREKYKDDPKRQQQEMTKLWREEGLSPTGMLGCLPMFLQSPVWIALYATLFFAVELRHEPAFYGIFQTISGGAWHFMEDLSMPDGAIPLPKGTHFSFPLWGTVTAINVLPILLGFVFFAHQKFLTPPTQATMTPEQESQQKLMKVMMVVMFPLMMYTAPSGLALYFITNSTIAIIENKWIRAHMNKHGMLDIENIRAAKREKGPSFLQRMAEASEAKKQIEQHGPRQPNPADRRNGRPR